MPPFPTARSLPVLSPSSARASTLVPSSVFWAQLYREGSMRRVEERQGGHATGLKLNLETQGTQRTSSENTENLNIPDTQAFLCVLFTPCVLCVSRLIRGQRRKRAHRSSFPGS